MSLWKDFNDAEPQQSYDLIPKGTLLKVRMTIRPGGYNDPAHDLTGGWATRSNDTGAIYLNAEFIVLAGPYAKRKLWSLIGLFSPKGEKWTNMGRTFLRAALDSAYGIASTDNGPEAQAARRIDTFADVNELEFVGRVDWEEDSHGQHKHVIKSAVTAEHKDYAALMGVRTTRAPASATTTPARATVPGRPSWAQ